MFHNEALQILDVLVAGAVEEPPRPAPPASPLAGACYIVAAGASGEWLGKARMVAAYTAGAWRFVAPAEGMTLLVRSTGSSATYRAGLWELGVVRGSSLHLSGQQVVGAREAAIPDPTGGPTQDLQARAAVAQILATLRQHGLIES